MENAPPVSDMLSQTEQAPGVLITTETQQVVSDTKWLAPTLINAWAAFGGGRIALGYRRIGSVVYLRGSLWGGASGSIAFKLPIGFRPLSGDLLAAGGSYPPTESTPIVIQTAGDVYIYFTAGVSAQASLDGICFLVD